LILAVFICELYFIQNQFTAQEEFQYDKLIHEKSQLQIN